MNTGDQNPQGSSEQEGSQEKTKTTADRAYEAMIAGGIRHYSDKALWDALGEVWKEDKKNGGTPPFAEWDKETRFSIFADTKKKILGKFPKEIRHYTRTTPSVNDSEPVELTPEQEQALAIHREKSLRKIEAMFGINPPTAENLEDQPTPEDSAANEPMYEIPTEPLDAKYRGSKSEAYVESDEERRYP